jgi:iron(III) transport system permease protein
MAVNHKLPSAFSAAAIGVLVLLPVLGLAFAIVDRQPDPFTGEVASMASLVSGAGVGLLLVRSMALAMAVAVGSVLCGGWLAWVEHRTQVPRWWALLTLLPLAMPSYLVAATVRSALSPGGWIGNTLGLPHMTGFAMAVVVLTVITAPLSQLIIGAALHTTSAAEEEAARALGASPKQVFQTITLPRLRPAIGFSGLLALLYAISDFGAVAVLDVPVLTWRLYLAVENQDVARAAVLGGATLMATLPLFMATRWMRGGPVHSGVANRRMSARGAATNTQRWLTTAVLLIVVGLGVFIPIATMGGWVFDGLQRDLAFVNPVGALIDTTGAALAGALLTVLLAALPAWVVVSRQRNKQAGSWLEDGVYLTSALPGVLLALGLMLAALHFSPFVGPGTYIALLGSGVLLMMGYATRYVAEVFAPLRVAFQGLDPRQIESAQVLGAGTMRRLQTVVLPSIAPGVAVAFMIGFNAIVKELPVTLLLGSATGLKTLSFRVWDRYNESLWHDAGVAGLLLVVLALGSAALTVRWRKTA